MTKIKRGDLFQWKLDPARKIVILEVLPTRYHQIGRTAYTGEYKYLELGVKGAKPDYVTINSLSTFMEKLPFNIKEKSLRSIVHESKSVFKEHWVEEMKRVKISKGDD